MKKFIPVILFFCTTICNAQIYKVADYTIGKTTLDNFYKVSEYDSTKGSIITSEAGYESIWVKLYFDSVYHDSKIYAIKFDAKNLDNYGWKLTSPTNARTKVFYITQVQLRDYVANNVLLTFYKNILTKIEYDLPASFFIPLTEKYQKAGDSSTETKTSSACAQTKSYNISKTVNIYNHENNAESILEYIEGTDAGCRPYSHFNIKIINQNLWQEYLNDAKSSLPPTQQKLSDERLNEMLKQLEKEEKKGKRKKNNSVTSSY